MIVKLRQKKPNYPDLTPGQPYVVIGIEGDEFRGNALEKSFGDDNCGND